MFIIYNKIIPFDGYICCNLFGILFARKTISMKTYRHEKIHLKLMQEMLWIFFYLWYFIEWLIKLIYYMDTHKAYKNISFEREAKEYEMLENYFETRKHYNWIHYV